MTLQRWTNPKASYVPRVTIRVAGSLAFSRGATNKYGFGEAVRYLTLAFDAGTGCVVIFPAKAGDPGAVELKRQLKTWLVWIRNFFHRFDIDHSRPRKFLLQPCPLADGAVQFCLDDELPIAAGVETAVHRSAED